MAAAVTIALAMALLMCACADARPGRRVTTDQRQQGELNIHAKLDNVLILVMPSTGAADLLSLAGLKHAGLLQTLLKKHKYDTAADEQNDVDAEIPPSGGAGQDEEVVATVEEMKPSSTRRPTDQPPATEATTATAGTTRATESAKAEATTTAEAEKAKDPSSTTESTEHLPPKEQPAITETVKQSVLTVTIHDEAEGAAAAKPAEADLKKGDDQIPEDKAPAKAPEVDAITKLESSKPSETAIVDKLVISDSPAHSYGASAAAARPEKKEQEAALVLPDTGKHVAVKTARKETRLEKALRLHPEEKYAPFLGSRVQPATAWPERARDLHASICAPGNGKWDNELRTCIYPDDTRSRAELARFLQELRRGVVIPTK